MSENSPECDSMTREEATRDRYWRLRKGLNELYRRQIVVGNWRKALDAMEDAVRKSDIVEAYRHQMVLEVLLR